MLKNNSFRRFAITSLFLLLSCILYNYPDDLVINYEEDDNVSKSIYLIDKNKYVAMVDVSCNINKDEVLGIHDMLTKKDCLPPGFSSYLPSSTKIINYSIDNKILKINYSKDFLKVDKGYEEKMLEMIIYSYTSLSNIDSIMIFVEDDLLDRIPNTNKRIPTLLNRDFGINKIVDINTLSNNVSFNVYYLGKGEDYYYIPVTYLVSNDGDVAQMIIRKLKSNSISSSLLTHISDNVKMVDYNIDGDTMEVIFAKELENIMFDGVMDEEVRYVLTASFADTFDVQDVDILFAS